MGMYDNIRCRYPLPDGFTGDLEYQTKDTDSQFLDDYEITLDGRLVHHEYRIEDVPKAERPYPNDDGPLGICGSMRRVPLGVVDVPFHGALCFYTGNKSGCSSRGYITEDGEHGWWREYTALFDHGKLLKIEGGKTLDPEPPISREEFWRNDSPKIVNPASTPPPEGA